MQQRKKNRREIAIKEILPEVGPDVTFYVNVGRSTKHSYMNLILQNSSLCSKAEA